MIFPRVHYAFAAFRGGGHRFGPPLNTPLIVLIVEVLDTRCQARKR